MGVYTKATLAWGFVIPEDKLVPLLQVFRKLDKKKATSKNPPPPPPKKRKKEDKTLLEYEEAEELAEYIQDVMASKKIGAFFEFMEGGIDRAYGGFTPSASAVAFCFCYRNNLGNEGKPLSHTVQRWGDNYGVTCTPLGPTLTADLAEVKGKAKELQDALHFKEAKIKVEEQWILSASLG